MNMESDGAYLLRRLIIVSPVTLSTDDSDMCYLLTLTTASLYIYYYLD